MSNTAIDLFIHSCNNGNIEGVKLAISRGVNSWNYGLYNASFFGHIDIVKLLISKGAHNWNDAFAGACVKGHIEILKLLISKGANNLNEGLHEACIDNNIELVKFLISCGADDYNDGLRRACKEGFTHIVNLLIMDMTNIPQYCIDLSDEQLYLFYKSGVTSSKKYKSYFDKMKRLDKIACEVCEEILIKDLSSIVTSY